MRSLKLINMKYVQCCAKDENFSDMFDYLDKMFDIIYEPKLK